MSVAFRIFACIGLLALIGGGASAQVTAPCYDNFDTPGTGFDLPGWTVDPASAGGVQWGVDATPATVGAGLDSSTFPPASPSAGSLNFNDGTDYDDGSAALTQVVTSPVITLTPITGSVFLNFSSCINCESGFDNGTLRVINAGTLAVIASFTWGVTGSGESVTQTPGRWTSYYLDLSAATAGVPTIQVEFGFVCDTSVNAFPGWFIDNFAIRCGDAIAPSVPTLLSPAPAAVVALPIALDWSDSTDSSNCGAGAVLQYIVQVDDDPLFGSVNLTLLTNVSSATITALAAGTWNWRVRVQDYNFNLATSTSQTFVIEAPIAPSAPDTLFVNTRASGAQSGDSGFVDPIIDESPVFSAVYRDANTVDNSIAVRYQVSDDPTFTAVLFDSGPTGMSPVLPKDGRCRDLSINISLNRDTVYYWRVQFTDAGGLTSPFSLAQSFRIGDDFEFGVRKGSTHHGRRCWVATAAFGSEHASTVQSLQSWRFGTMETSAAGRVVSRAYHVMGAEASRSMVRSNPVAGAIQSLGSILGGAGSMVALGALALLAMLGISRFVARI